MGDLYASTGSLLGPLMLKLSRGVPEREDDRFQGCSYGQQAGRLADQLEGVTCGVLLWHSKNLLTFN